MITQLLKDTQDKMDNTLKVLENQLSGLRTGKASPALVENIMVTYYGVPTRLRDMANISTPEARLITIAPYDPSVLSEIEKSILAANIGVTPQNDGRLVRVPVPELSEERRKEMTKVAGRMAEDARVSVRNVRRDANESAKALQKNAKISEDERDQALEKIQKATDGIIAKIDSAVKAKEAEIMAV
ncbi:MAG: ribosome recycling factor [Kiritimatiellae bacterium]|jgi:ribosome recycling factor|nr:ribosome recycling factor [Kiritimatiellia bacterium]